MQPVAAVVEGPVERLRVRVSAAANPVGSLQHQDAKPPAARFASGGQTGDAGPARIVDQRVAVRELFDLRSKRRTDACRARLQAFLL